MAHAVDWVLEKKRKEMSSLCPRKTTEVSSTADLQDKWVASPNTFLLDRGKCFHPQNFHWDCFLVSPWANSTSRGDWRESIHSDWNVTGNEICAKLNWSTVEWGSTAPMQNSLKNGCDVWTVLRCLLRVSNVPRSACLLHVFNYIASDFSTKKMHALRWLFAWVKCHRNTVLDRLATGFESWSVTIWRTPCQYLNKCSRKRIIHSGLNCKLWRGEVWRCLCPASHTLLFKTSLPLFSILNYYFMSDSHH